MTTNSFSILSSWDLRADTAAELGERFLKALDALSNISPHFRTWWIFNSSLAVGDAWKDPSAVQYFSLDYARSHMTEIVEMGVHRADYNDYPLPEAGYHVTADNSQLTTPRTVNLRAWGADNQADSPSRGASFNTEYTQIPDPEIITYSVFKSVLMALVSNFDVAYAEAYSSELSDQWRGAPDPRFIDLTWMTYLSASLARQITPPDDVPVEHMANGGILMIAAEQTFNVHNKEHMRAARSILKALKPLNDAADKKRQQEQERWKKEWLSRPSS